MLSEAKHLVIASEPIGRAQQSTVRKTRIMWILCSLIASLTLTCKNRRRFSPQFRAIPQRQNML